MLTIREEIFKIKLINKLHENGIDEAIKYLFDSNIVDNLNLALDFFEILLNEINIEFNEEMYSNIIDIMSKKTNIDELCKYDNLNGVVGNALNQWKEEKELFVNLLIESVNTLNKGK